MTRRSNSHYYKNVGLYHNSADVPTGEEAILRIIAICLTLAAALLVPGLASAQSGQTVELTDKQMENLVRRSYQNVAMFNVNNKFALDSDNAMNTGDTAYGGEMTGYGASNAGKRSVYVLSESGGAATWVVRLVRFKPLAVE